MTTAPCLTIDLNALADNWRLMDKKSGTAETAAVIKADGYGLGIKQVARTLANAGCKTFFTALIEEAQQVREISHNSRIFVLNGIMEDSIDEAKQAGLIPVLSNLDQIAIWAEHGNRNPSALHIDTGMNRLGITTAEAEGLAIKFDTLQKFNPTTIISHLACADDPAEAQNERQLEKFNHVSKLYANLEKSFANSAGIMLGPDYQFDLTRPGISLFGGEAVNNVANPMRPVVEAKVRILQIRHAKKGEAVGYGPHCVLERDTLVAVCSGGYADGFHRTGSGAGVPLRHSIKSGGKGAIGGELVPVIGRVSMDLIAFDVTDVPEAIVATEKWVELFGKTIAIDDAARACGTIGYELLTSLGTRYKREYIGG